MGGFFENFGILISVAAVVLLMINRQRRQPAETKVEVLSEEKLERLIVRREKEKDIFRMN